MKRGMILYAALALLLCVAVSCEMPSSGKGSVSGVVTQDSTGEPVEGVNVAYSNIVKITDELGRYSLDTIPEGLQGITFSKMGFATLVSQVDVQKDVEIEHNVTVSVMSSGWAVGDVETEYGTIFYTADGGLTWVRQGNYTVVPPDDLYCVCAVNKNCCWVAGDTTFNVLRSRMEYSILKTSDGGETWRRQGQTIGDLSPYPIVGITAMDTSTVFAVTDRNVILKGTTGGNSWTQCYNSGYTDGYNAISTADGVHVWAGGVPIEGGSTGLDYSEDGGSSWKFVPVSGILSEATITGISAVDTNLVYISGSFGVMRTFDKGTTWEYVSGTGADTVLNVSALGSNCVWVGLDGGRLSYTWDAFEHTESGVLDFPSRNPQITAISFLGDAAEGALTYCSSQPTSPGGILFTIDGGASWGEPVIPYKVSLRDVSFAGTKH